MILVLEEMDGNNVAKIALDRGGWIKIQKRQAQMLCRFCDAQGKTPESFWLAAGGTGNHDGH